MREQIKGFNKAYEKVKNLGFENYFCLPQTTWEEAYRRFKSSGRISNKNAIHTLEENVDIVLKEAKLPFCKKCKHLFSPQEFKVGFELCEHCQ